MKWLNVAGALLLLGGCAALGARTEGTSGPLAWRVADLRVETREIQGKAVNGRAFTLVIRNISDRTLTITTMGEKRYQPGTGSSSSAYAVRRELRPGAERKISRYATLVCNSPATCTDSGGAQPMFQIDFAGVDDQNRPIEARLDITLPRGLARSLHPASPDHGRRSATPRPCRRRRPRSGGAAAWRIASRLDAGSVSRAIDRE